MASGCSVRRSVVPGCPFWPPGLRPDGSRKLVVRGGFFSPSLDGGLPLLELSNPSRRSSSATRASRLLMISSLGAVSASSRAITSVGLTGAAGASSLCVTPAVSKVRVMDRLTHAADSESSFFIPTRYLGSYNFSRNWAPGKWWRSQDLNLKLLTRRPGLSRLSYSPELSRL